MIFVTTATGERHEALAQQMIESFIKWSWPSLILARGCDHPSMDDLWKGRGLKTRFAHFVPEGYEGPVAFIDCDCVAVGPYPGDPPIPEGGMAGVVLQRMKNPDGTRRNFMASTILFLPSRPEAVEVCDAWYTNLRERGDKTGSDEPSLFRATLSKPAVETGWYGQPMENLIHLAETHPTRKTNEISARYRTPDELQAP